MRIIEFDDSFDSKNSAEQGSVECTSYPAYANDAAFEAVKGGPGTEGDSYFNTTLQQIRYHDGTSWVTMSLPGAGIHAASHVQGGADEIDGDNAAIDFVPTNYTPDFTGTPSDNNLQLTAHLNGIDAALVGGIPAHAASHLSGAGDELDADRVDIDFAPSNYTPDTTPVEVTLVAELTSHLAGIDNQLIAIPTHAPSHISGGSDEIDGDVLDINYSPVNYTEDTSPAEVTLTDELTAHLAGIDNELIIVPAHAVDHASGGTDELDGDVLDIDFTPTNYTPDTSPGEVTSVDELTAHLKGIDDVAGQGGVSFFAEVSDLVDFNTTSAPPVVIASMTHTITEDGDYLAFFNSSALVSTNGADVIFYARKNTVVEASSQRDFWFSGSSGPLRHVGITHYFSGLVNTDVIDIAAQTSSGTLTVQERVFYIMRIA